MSLILSSSLTKTKETTIFHHSGNNIQTADREISMIARFEEPLIVVLGNVLSAEECEELILLSKDKMQRSKIGAIREVNEIRTSSGAFIEEKEHPSITAIEKRISEIMNILEGPVEVADRIDKASCDNIDCCATRLLWTKIKNSIDEVMESITLQDIVDDYNEMKYKNSLLELKRREE